MKDILLNCLNKIIFNGSVRRRVWKKLSEQMRHGMGLDYSLELLAAQALKRKSPLARIFDNIGARLKTGHGLETALAGYVPAEEIMLIAGGQESGALANGFALAAGLIEAKSKILKAVAGAISYPLLLMGMCVVLLWTISFTVIPQFMEISDPRTWTGMARALWIISDFVASPFGLAVFVIIVAGILFAVFSMPFWTGHIRAYLDRYPPWSVYRLTIGCVWLFTVATLMRSGKQLMHILDAMLNSDAISPFLRERVVAVAHESGLGKNFGEALADTRFNFPDIDMVDDLCAYARLPGFAERLHEIASDWLNHGIEKIQLQARLVNTVFIVFIGVMIFGIVTATGDFQNQITNMGAY